jgi:hypothetical protein
MIDNFRHADHEVAQGAESFLLPAWKTSAIIGGKYPIRHFVARYDFLAMPATLTEMKWRCYSPRVTRKARADGQRGLIHEHG